jgi:hypothetical protein
MSRMCWVCYIDVILILGLNAVGYNLTPLRVLQTLSLNAPSQIIQEDGKKVVQ